jgi:hypothetical protein
MLHLSCQVHNIRFIRERESESIALKLKSNLQNYLPLILINSCCNTWVVCCCDWRWSNSSHRCSIEFKSVDCDRIHGLIESLSRRVQTVLQINGCHNRCWICVVLMNACNHVCRYVTSVINYWWRGTWLLKKSSRLS